MFKMIYKHLENRGFDVYAPGQRHGLCRKPYVVVKERGRQPFLTGLASELVDFIVFYPLDAYSELNDYLESLQDALADLRELKNTHVLTPAVIDSVLKAYTVSATYQIYKKRRGAI